MRNLLYESDALAPPNLLLTMSLRRYIATSANDAEDDEKIVVPDDLKTFDLFDQYLNPISDYVNNFDQASVCPRTRNVRKPQSGTFVYGPRVARDAAGFGQSDETSQKYHLRPLAHSLRHASKRAVIPKRSANSLVFEFTPDSKDFWSNTCTLLSF